VEYFTGHLPTAARQLQSSTELIPADVNACQHCTVFICSWLLPSASLLPLHVPGPSYRGAILLNLSSSIRATNHQFGVGAASASSAGTSETCEEESAVPQLKHPRLLASYSTKPTTPTPGSSMQQLQKYLAMETTSIDDDCMRFWMQNSSTLDKLVSPALRALGVPASSAAVERVFSQGGIILRPHRA